LLAHAHIGWAVRASQASREKLVSDMGLLELGAAATLAANSAHGLGHGLIT
jgi:hypothetical protein